MRVLRIVLALVAIPFVAVLAQRPFEDAKNCGQHLSSAEKANARSRRANASLALVHEGKHGVMDRACESPEPPPSDPPPSDPPPSDPPPSDPPPPSCAVSALPVSGSLSITGKVRDGATGSGIAGWCVTLTSDAGSAVAQSDASGNYVFGNIPDGTYLICEVMKAGWQQTFPSAAMGGVPCPEGLGHSFPLGGMSASFVDFRNMQL
jgi:hypothetical protein